MKETLTTSLNTWMSLFMIKSSNAFHWDFPLFGLRLHMCKYSKSSQRITCKKSKYAPSEIPSIGTHLLSSRSILFSLLLVCIPFFNFDQFSLVHSLKSIYIFLSLFGFLFHLLSFGNGTKKNEVYIQLMLFVAFFVVVGSLFHFHQENCICIWLKILMVNY